MFWYIFAIIICALIIAASFLIRAMSRRAAELNVVETVFESTGDARFCFISDVHIAMMPVKWGDVLTAVKEAEPEFVLITGDLVNKPGDVERAKQFVFTLAAGAGIPVIITPGNHDNEIARGLPGGKDALRREFTSLKGDVRVLDDEYTVAGNVLIGGLNDVGSRERPCPELIEKWAEIAASKGLGFVVATHNADLLLETATDSGPASATARLCPALCGHTHGGQIRLVRGIEFTLLKKDKLPKQGIYYGRHKVGSCDVYITSGLGCALVPLRSGTNPEVVVVILAGM